ncbi:MAG: hypothetical protein JWQ20_3332 [Conexibacter sp.]|nr:hypothetical protein [Conexibacter sp.]
MPVAESSGRVAPPEADSANSADSANAASGDGYLSQRLLVYGGSSRTKIMMMIDAPK